MTGCDPGHGIAWTNNSDTFVCIYFGNDLDDFSLDVRPMTTRDVGTIKAVWEDLVVVRDVEGEVLLREELTWDELGDQDYRFVIPENVSTEEDGATEGPCPGDD